MMYNEQRQSAAFSYGPFVWWMGVAVDRKDPEKLGRVKVRIYGYHSGDESEIPNNDLFWAVPVLPTTSASISGVGSSPTGIVEGTTVIGFFADGHTAQTPVILGTLAGKPTKPNDGFKDPEGKYPKFEGESDCNRLSRNENIDETCVQTKRDNIDESEEAVFGTGGERPKWKEKETEYAAEYPYSHTYESESGHIMEFDDTEGKERIHLYHRSGTFQEYHPEGSLVTKVTKDNYSVIMGDDYCHVIGDCRITVDGEAKVLVKGNVTLECAGNMDHTVHGNYNVKVMGDYKVETAGNLTYETGGVERHTASLIFLN